jgi:hypothetical protein
VVKTGQVESDPQLRVQRVYDIENREPERLPIFYEVENYATLPSGDG